MDSLEFDEHKRHDASATNLDTPVLPLEAAVAAGMANKRIIDMTQAEILTAMKDAQVEGNENLACVYWQHLDAAQRDAFIAAGGSEPEQDHMQARRNLRDPKLAHDMATALALENDTELERQFGEALRSTRHVQPLMMQ